MSDAVVTPRGSRLQRLGSRIGSKLSVIRLKPFDTSTPEGRAQERMRRAGLTALASALAKVISISSALISVPLTIHYLGTERYGMWMVITSFAMLLSFADLGMGNGILNAIAQANGQDDRQAMRAIVSSGYFILSLISVTILAGLAVAYPYVNWAAIFNVHSEQAIAEAGPALAVFVACFAIAIPLGVVQRVQIGLQQGFGNSIWQCFGSIFGLIGILVTVHFQLGLPWLVLALAGAPLVASLANSIVLFGFWRPDLLPKFGLVSRHRISAIARIGMLFVVLQIVQAVTANSDNLIIAQFLGASAVSSYAVPAQLFGVIGAVISMALQPLWPAYGEALARGDSAWVRRTFLRSLKIAIITAFTLASLLVISGREVVWYWTHGAIAPPLQLLLGFGVWKLIEAGSIAVAMYLNGTNVIRFQIGMALVSGLAALALKLVLISRLGVSGAIWATVIAYSLFVCLPTFVFIKRRLFVP